MSGTTLTVLRVLAHHVGRPLSGLRPAHTLDGDLDLTALEVVLVALEVESVVDIEVDIDGLEAVGTVGELCSFLSGRVSVARRDETRGRPTGTTLQHG
jgi:acyl carrier protein